jgi:transposase
VSLRLAREIIAETGLDMSRFPTAAHLVSWAGLAPVARQSGPRQRKPSKGQGDVYLKTYCAQAANGTGNTGTFLGERLRRLTRRLGATKAMCAVQLKALGVDVTVNPAAA